MHSIRYDVSLLYALQSNFTYKMKKEEGAERNKNGNQVAL